VASDFRKDADEIASLYVALVKKKLKEEDADAVVKLVSICERIADLSELLENTAEAHGEAEPTAPSRPGRRGRAGAPPPTPTESA